MIRHLVAHRGTYQLCAAAIALVCLAEVFTTGAFNGAALLGLIASGVFLALALIGEPK